MTIERRLARAGFTLTRDYPVPVPRVWDAFAEEEQKLAWFGTGDSTQSVLEALGAYLGSGAMR